MFPHSNVDFYPHNMAYSNVHPWCACARVRVCLCFWFELFLSSVLLHSVFFCRVCLAFPSNPSHHLIILPVGSFRLRLRLLFSSSSSVRHLPHSPLITSLSFSPLITSSPTFPLITASHPPSRWFLPAASICGGIDAWIPVQDYSDD